MRYRAEIDGLRAFAIVPVVLFHAGFKLFSGGFVGVDVFFVISGYLITSIILAELEAGNFSIARFYERRARRILPALFFVMAVSIPFAWQWLLPSDMKGFSKSLVGVSVFSSNIVFWLESGYFDTGEELKPLLHTWSLAVEEQFYVLFPLLLMLMWHLGKRWIVGVLTLVSLISLSCAQWGALNRPAATFFLLPTRGWELAIGALVAIYLDKKESKGSSVMAFEVYGLIGISLIIYSVFSYSKATPFPSIYALVPTVGAALVIVFAQPQTVVGKLLSNKVFVGIGLISYSTYLWHQPLFAFVRLRSFQEPSPAIYIVLSLVALAFAYISWRFVERPFRDKKRIDARGVFAFAAVGSLVFCSFGLVGYARDGFAQRTKWRGIENAIETKKESGSGEKYCRDNRVDSKLGPLVCLIGDSSKEPEGVLWGDSFAGALIYGMNAQLTEQGRSFYAVSSDGCIPIEGASRTVRLEFGCTEERHRTFVREVLRLSGVKRIVWIGAFANLTGGTEGDYLIDGVPSTPLLVKNKIIETLDKFKRAGKSVVLVGDTPRFPIDTADYSIKKFVATGGNREAIVQVVSRIDALKSLNQADILDEAKEHSSVVDSLDIFCGPVFCASHDENGHLLFVDGAHLSHVGSLRLSKEVIRRMY